MAVIHKVALAGATGNFGKPVLQALLDAKFEVTVLTRSDSNHTFPPSVKVAKVDYADAKVLASILHGQDAFISTVGGGGLTQQKSIVDAAVAAGVKRLIPSEFGSELENPKARAFPLWAPKLELQEHIEKVTKGTQTSWTVIRNGPFLDFCVDVGLLINIKKKSINLYDGGDIEFTTTPIPAVAEAIIAVLRKPDETENRVVRVQGALVTQNQLLRLAQKYNGEEDWQITTLSSEEVEKEAWRKLQENPKDIPRSVFIDFLVRAIFGQGYGGKFGDNLDNEMLGIKQMSGEDVETFVKSRASATSS